MHKRYSDMIDSCSGGHVKKCAKAHLTGTAFESNSTGKSASLNMSNISLCNFDLCRLSSFSEKRSLRAATSAETRTESVEILFHILQLIISGSVIPSSRCVLSTWSFIFTSGVSGLGSNDEGVVSSFEGFSFSAIGTFLATLVWECVFAVSVCDSPFFSFCLS